MSKKLLLIAALGVAGIATAQSEQAILTKSPVHSIRETGRVSNVQKATIFSENFSTGVGQFTISNGATSNAPHWTHYSSGANRFMYVPVGTLAETQRTFDEYLTMTNPVVIPNDAENYRFQAQIQLNPYWLVPGDVATAGGGNFKIEATNDDGATWTTMWFEEDAALLASTFTTEFEDASGFTGFTPRVNIPAAFRGVDVKFRFALTGTYTATAYVYSAEIVSVPDEIVTAVDVIIGDLNETQEYKIMPLSQARPTVLGVVGKNFGFGDVTRDVEVQVVKASTSTVVATETVTAHNFQLGVSDTVYVDLAYTPDELGDYYMVAMLKTTDATLNDTTASRLQITEYTYGQADRDEISSWLGQEEQEVGYGNTYEQLVGDAQIFGIKTLFYQGTTVGATIEVRVNVSGQNGWDNNYLGEYIIKSTDVSPNYNNLRPVYIPFEYGVDVFEGDFFMVELRQKNEGVLRILNAPSTNEVGTLVYGPFGTGNAVNWYRGWDATLILEADYQDRLSISKVEGMENVTVYPNPSNGVVNISNTANEVLTVSVKDITGKEVVSTSVFGNGSVDLGNFGAGVYVFEISNGTARSAKRVIVK